MRAGQPAGLDVNCIIAANKHAPVDRAWNFPCFSGAEAQDGGACCVICKHGGNRSRGPLGFIAHVSVCSSMATALRTCSALHSHSGGSCTCSHTAVPTASSQPMDVDGQQGQGEEDVMLQEEVAGAMVRLVSM